MASRTIDLALNYRECFSRPKEPLTVVVAVAAGSEDKQSIARQNLQCEPFLVETGD